MRFAVFFVVFILFFTPTVVAQTSDIDILDANLVAKLHLDPNPRDGQIVGAYVMSFRPKGDKVIKHLSVLLNPGLQFIRAERRKRPLKATSQIAAIEGMDMLELNHVTIDLGKPLKESKRTNIIIHFRGYLEDLSWTGLVGVQETLNPDFTILRSESFAYPVFADPNIKSIKAAWATKPFIQFADITLPEPTGIVGTLEVSNKTVEDEKTNVELKNKHPTSPLALAIAPYERLKNGPISVAYLKGNKAGATRVVDLFTAKIAQLSHSLGTPKGTLNIVELPTGYVTKTKATTLFVGSDYLADPTLSKADKNRIYALWNFNQTGRSGHWGNGIDRAVYAALSNPSGIDRFQSAQFEKVTRALSSDKYLQKTPISEMAPSATTDDISAFAFSVLYDLLGRDAFFDLVRSLRSDLSAGYIDLETVTDALLKTVQNKKAKKFIKNWFSGSKAGKDMAKAKNFAALIKRYK